MLIILLCAPGRTLRSVRTAPRCFFRIFKIMITTIEIDIEPQVVFDNLTAKEQNEFIDMNIDCASTEKLIDELNRRGGINI